MPPVQSRAEELDAFINRYLQRVGGEAMRAYMNDPMYHHHVQAMRRWLVVTDLAMEDEGIAVEQRDRVLRSVLYGGMDDPPEIRYVVDNDRVTVHRLDEQLSQRTQGGARL